MTVALGQHPANTNLQNAVWPTGMLTFSVLAEADMPGFVLCDGRRISKAGANAALATLVGHAYEASPGVDPGDGKFRVPPFVENAANDSQARMPIGQDPDPGAPAALRSVGGKAGALGHTHGPGTLAIADHGHGPGSLGAPDHGHGAVLSANHGHSLYNDAHRIAGACGGCQNYKGAVEYAFGGGNAWYFLHAADPGIAGSIGGSQHSLAIAGSSAGMSAPQPWGGATAPADAAYLTALVYVKL